MYGLAGGSFTVTDAADACGGDSPHPVAASAVAITIKNLKAPLLPSDTLCGADANEFLAARGMVAEEGLEPPTRGL